jgi:PPOX class probable F420-dependent enzyme
MADATEIYRAKPTQDEIDEVLATRSRAAVATLNADGSVHLSYVIFLWEDDRFYCETSSVTRKARNLADRPTASFLLDGRASTGQTVMLEAEGTGRVVVGADAESINLRLREKYIREAMDEVNEVWSGLDDVAMEITPLRWRSWSGGALASATNERISTSWEEIWRQD